ncbi:MAG TPA: polysaccharide deacetylase family protein [Puia sp.]|nr:polysaccharide deacetylase family protein [Puia sp.]
MTRYITTSWDDGHPSDGRLAGLLAKYDLKGTFYVPKVNPGHRVMREQDIRELGRSFEIGGHTLRHVSLKKLSAYAAWEEIQGSRDWLRSIQGKEPVSFCPPFGEFAARDLALIREAGFRVIRSTELLSTGRPAGVLPTTLQVFDHSRFTYFKHLLKRGRIQNLALWCGSGFATDTVRLLDHYLEHLLVHGGCLHIWGHSWEIDHNRHWRKLEKIFSIISRLNGFSYVENGQLDKINSPVI